MLPMANYPASVAGCLSGGPGASAAYGTGGVFTVHCTKALEPALAAQHSAGWSAIALLEPQGQDEQLIVSWGNSS